MARTSGKKHETFYSKMAETTKMSLQRFVHCKTRPSRAKCLKQCFSRSIVPLVVINRETVLSVFSENTYICYWCICFCFYAAWFEKNWWSIEDEENKHNCTAEQMDAVARGSLSIYYAILLHNSASAAPSISGMVSGGAVYCC